MIGFAFHFLRSWVKIPRGPAAVKWSLPKMPLGLSWEGWADDETEPEDPTVFVQI